MNDRQPDLVEEWAAVSARAAAASGLARRASGGVRSGAVRSGGVRPVGGWSISALVVAVVVVIAGLSLRPSAVEPGASGSPVPGSQVVDRVDDGTFRLELTTPRGTYSPAEAIEPVARLTWIGPDAQVRISHAERPISFSIEEVDGKRAMGGFMNDPCLSTVLSKDVALAASFVKAGVPDAAFDVAWYRDPVLRLPTGTWRISATLDVYLGGCGAERHQLDVSNVIEVVAGLSSPAPSDAPSPEPTLSADAAVALEFVRKYEDGLATGHLDSVWTFLSPWSRTTAGSFGTFFDSERRTARTSPGPVVIDDPSRDPALLDPDFLGARAANLAAVADPARTFVVSVRRPAVDGAAAATENLVVAPIDGEWLIWLDTAPGQYGAWAYPAGCAAFGFSERRCAAVVQAAAAQVGVDPGAATSIWLMSEPGCGGDPLAATLDTCARTLAFVAGVRFDLPGLDPVRGNIFCGPGPQTLVCSETPEIWAVDLHGAGYWDTPCTGEAPDGCASPLPSLGAAASDRGTELRIATIDVPVGAVGHREVEIGRAILVDGLVQEARFSIPDPAQVGFLIDPGLVRLELRSTIEGRPPFESAYARGAFDGPEEVRVILVFDVAETSPDAVIRVTDVLVR